MFLNTKLNNKRFDIIQDIEKNIVSKKIKLQEYNKTCF